MIILCCSKRILNNIAYELRQSGALGYLPVEATGNPQYICAGLPPFLLLHMGEE